MAKTLLIFSLFYLWPQGQLSPSEPPEFIVWNVGQGQWITISDRQTCTHIDMGGDWWPRQKLKELCSYKTNQVYFSHGDWDHIGFLKNYKKLFPDLCLGQMMTDPKNQNWLRQIPKCSSPANSALKKVNFARVVKKSNSANDYSDIYMFNKQFLIPGDSPKRQEKIWVINPQVKNTQFLVLGHHGSYTSTSNFMLQRLPGLMMTIASARKNKYGHPHKKILQRLQERKIPNLTTEDWGNIRIQIR